jgi:DNA repair ATPase RecN
MTISLSKIEVGLAALRSKHQQAAGQLALLERQKNEKLDALEKVQEDIQIWQQVQMLFAKASDYARQQLKERVEKTVTAALHAVFGDERMRFEIAMRTIGGVPAAEWSVISCYGDATVTGDPESSRGGGVADVVSLALRLSLLELSQPKPQGLGPVLLDEVGKHVSADYSPNMAAFLQQYARQTGRQVLFITHQAPLADIADLSYRVNQTDGISEAVRR